MKKGITRGIWRTLKKLTILLGIFPFAKRMKLWTDGRTRQMMKHYATFIRRGDLCFDIGANVGNRTEIFLGLGARVVVLEPQKKCTNILQRSFAKELTEKI